MQQAAHALMQQQMLGIREELNMQQQRFMEEQRQATQAALQQQLESLAAAGVCWRPRRARVPPGAVTLVRQPTQPNPR